MGLAWIPVVLVLVLGSGMAAGSSNLHVVKMPTSIKDGRMPLRKETRPASSTAAGILRTGYTYRSSSNYNRYQYIIVGPADASKAARLKTKSFVYQSATEIVRTWSAGVSYGQAVANGWLLRDTAGNYLKSRGRGLGIGDVGSPSYRRAWLKNVSRLLARSRVDGVFIDGVNANVQSLTGGVAAAKYPTQRSWEKAMADFIAFVGPALKAKGFYVLASAIKYVSGDERSDDASLTAAWWRRIGPSLSGLMTEYFLQNPINVAQLRTVGPEWYNHWDGWQKLVSVAQSVGADFFGDTYASTTNTQAMRYAKASFLLNWDGRRGGLFIDCGCPDPWNSAWTANIGGPVRAKFQRRVGVWQRNYRRGTVVVNATTSSIDVIVKDVSYTLAPADGLILRGR